MRGAWRTSARRTGHGSTSLTWGTSPPTDRRRLTSSLLVCPIALPPPRFFAEHFVAVTDPNGRIPRPGQTLLTPRTASEFADYFKNSLISDMNRQDMEQYRQLYVAKPELRKAYLESVRSERSRHTTRDSPYMLSIAGQVHALMVRRVQIMRGAMTALLIEIAYVAGCIRDQRWGC